MLHRLPSVNKRLAFDPFQTNGIFHKAKYNSQDGLLYIMSGHRL